MARKGLTGQLNMFDLLRSIEDVPMGDVQMVSLMPEDDVEEEIPEVVEEIPEPQEEIPEAVKEAQVADDSEVAITESIEPGEQEVREAQEVQEEQEVQEVQVVQEAQEVQEVQETQDVPEVQASQEIQEIQVSEQKTESRKTEKLRNVSKKQEIALEEKPQKVQTVAYTSGNEKPAMCRKYEIDGKEIEIAYINYNKVRITKAGEKPELYIFDSSKEAVDYYVERMQELEPEEE